MFQILDQGDGRVVGLKVTGKITAEDMTALTRHLEAEIGGAERPLGADKGGTINNAMMSAQGAGSIAARIAELEQELAAFPHCVAED